MPAITMPPVSSAAESTCPIAIVNVGLVSSAPKSVR